jgi:hypothetical protein
MSSTQQVVLVNRAAWETPEPIPDDWAVANAPRPIAGRITWTGQFRHGTFYAAGPYTPELTASWCRDDAWPVTFTDNAEIARKVEAKLAEYETTLDELGMSMGDLACDMQLPWHENT